MFMSQRELVSRQNNSFIRRDHGKNTALLPAIVAVVFAAKRVPFDKELGLCKCHYPLLLLVAWRIFTLITTCCIFSVGSRKDISSTISMIFRAQTLYN